MKYTVTFLLLLLSIQLRAQGTSPVANGLFGSWVKVKAWQYSGGELPDNFPPKYDYLRYQFKPNGKMYKSIDPVENGISFDYSVEDKLLRLSFLNYSIGYLSADSLMLVEMGPYGIDGSSVCYAFVPENIYQQRLPITADMLVSTVGTDTLFTESEKIHTTFSFDESFDMFLRSNVREFKKIKGHDEVFFASFVINEGGQIDSIHIDRGMNERFDKQYIEGVKKSGPYWQAASHNGKPVRVRYMHRISFPSSETALGWMKNSADAKRAMDNGDLETAIGLFTKCLEARSDDKEALFYRAACYYDTGRPDKACEDWHALQALHTKRADHLIDMYCK